jgi:hypothetical protein
MRASARSAKHRVEAFPYKRVTFGAEMLRDDKVPGFASAEVL